MHARRPLRRSPPAALAAGGRAGAGGAGGAAAGAWRRLAAGRHHAGGGRRGAGGTAVSIVVERLTHVYNPRSPGKLTALRDVSLTIEDGACAAIVGVTGSGKSTLVQHFNGLLRPTAGRVIVDGINIGTREARGERLRDLRRRVGLLFQFPGAQLFAATIYEDVAFGPRQTGLADAEGRVRVCAALDAVGIDSDEATLQRSPFALSGGLRPPVANPRGPAGGPPTVGLGAPKAGLGA